MDEFKNVVSKNSMYRSLIATALFMVLGFIESRMLPWGLGAKALVPLAVTYLLLGGSVGTQHPDDIKHAAVHGSLMGAVVYLIIFTWLFAVGFFRGGVAAGLGKMLFGIASVVIVSVSVFELSKVLKIQNDNPSSS